MDAHLLTKIIHMTAVAAALMVFVLRASTLFIGVQGQQPNPAGRKALVALQHLSLQWFYYWCNFTGNEELSGPAVVLR